MSIADPRSYKYWAFVSYSQIDEKSAKRFHEALETYALPKDLVGLNSGEWGKVPKRLMPVFRDRDELPSASDLGAKLVDALDQARTLLVVCSPAAAKSRWVNEEIKTFKARGREHHVFAIIVDGEPNASDNPDTEAAECFPPALRYRVSSSGEITKTRAEPIAADARKHKDGFERAVLKTVAGMLGIDFASLVKRDEERRSTRTRIVIAGLTAVLAVVSSLAVWGWIEKTRAETALRDAVASKLPLESRAILEGERLAPADAALLLAAAAYRLRPDKEAYRGLQFALDATARTSKVVSFPGPTVAMSPDQRTVVTLEGGRLLLYDAASGQARGVPMLAGERAELVGAVFQGFVTAFSADGKMIASGGDKALHLWDAASGKPVSAPLQGHRERITAVAFSVDGKTLASAADGVQLWDAATGRMSGGRFNPSGGQVSNMLSLAFSNDGRTLAVGTDNTLWLWDIAAAKTRGAGLVGHTKPITSIAFNADDRVLVSAGMDGTIRIWDVSTGSALTAPLHDSGNYVSTVALSPNGRTMVSGSYDGTLQLWDTSTGRRVGAPLQAHLKNVTAASFSPDGAALSSIGWDGTLRVWDLAEGPHPNRSATGTTAKLAKFAFSPDGKTVVALSSEGIVREWNPPAGPPTTVGARPAGMEIVALNADASTVVSSAPGTLALWDTATSKPRGVAMAIGRSTSWIAQLTGHVPAAFSPDGRTLVSGTWDTTLRLWDATSGVPNGAPLQGHTARVTAVAFSADGKTIVSASEDKTLRLWDAAARRVRGEPVQIGGTAYVVAFSGDGKTIVASSDSQMHFWDVATGRPRGAVMRSPGSVGAVAFSSDGRTLVSGGWDNTLRLWDTDTGQPLGAPFQGHSSPVVSVAFSPDSKTIVSGSKDGSVRVWDAPSVWIDRVCAKLVLNLSIAQWKQYVGEVPYVEQCPGLPVRSDRKD